MCWWRKKPQEPKPGFYTWYDAEHKVLRIFLLGNKSLIANLGESTDDYKWLEAKLVEIVDPESRESTYDVVRIHPNYIALTIYRAKISASEVEIAARRLLEKLQQWPEDGVPVLGIISNLEEYMQLNALNGERWKFGRF